MLPSAPALRHFDDTAHCEVHTGASGLGIGAILVQRDTDSSMDDRVVSFAGRALTEAERNHPINDKECLAIVQAMKKFRDYFHGHHFKVISDHHVLCSLSSIKH